MKVNKSLFLKKVLKKFWSKEFLRYFIIGFSSMLLDIGTLYYFKEFFGLTAIISIVINQLIVFCYVFFLNKIWVFSVKGGIMNQILRYCILAAANYIVAIIWMWLFHNLLGQNYLLVRLFNIALSTVWNFLLYKFFVYRAITNMTVN